MAKAFNRDQMLDAFDEIGWAAIDAGTRLDIAVFGGSGWGKTTFIRSLVVSLAATHTPAMVRFFILDLGGRNLSIQQLGPAVFEALAQDVDRHAQERKQTCSRDQ